jgi:monoamine oxidase
LSSTLTAPTPPTPREQSRYRDAQRDAYVLPKLPPALTEQVVVIVGAGISGLETAARLRASGMQVTVYEGNNRVGGRIFTDTVEGHRIERGAELVNEWDASLRCLVSHLGLHLRNIYRGEQKGQRLGFVDSEGLTPLTDLIRDLKPLQEKMKQDIVRCGSIDAAEQDVACFTLKEYAQSAGLGERTLQLLGAMFENEYGIPEDQITASGLFKERFHLLDPENPTVWGEGYAKYVVSEGTGAVTDELAERLDAVHLGHRLTKIARTEDGYNLTFNHDGEQVVRHTPLLVIAMPYTALRHVDITEAGFSPVRRQCIEQMTYGHSGKIFIESETPGDNRNIDEFVDLTVGYSVWNEDRNSSNPGSRWTVYTHGTLSVSHPELVQHLNESITPGFHEVFFQSSWDDQFSGGSYSIDNSHLPMKGRQPTEISGQLYFVGEHTQALPSYMDAAVRSAEETADLIAEHVLKRAGELERSFSPRLRALR